MSDTITGMKSCRSPSDLVIALSVVPFIACSLLCANNVRNMVASQEKLKAEIKLNQSQADAAFLAATTYQHDHLKDSSSPPVLRQEVALFNEVNRLNLNGNKLVSASLRAQARPAWYPVLNGLAMIPFLACLGRRVWSENRKAHRKKNGHCIKCGYSLIGNISGPCPECGFLVAIVE